MYLIQGITTDALQTQSLILPDNTSVDLKLYFSLIQQGWFASLTYINFEINNMRVTNSPNMLRQFKNLIPFGMACITVGGREPTQNQDFATAAANLYVLSAAEVQEYEDYLSGEI